MPKLTNNKRNENKKVFCFFFPTENGKNYEGQYPGLSKVLQNRHLE